MSSARSDTHVAHAGQRAPNHVVLRKCLYSVPFRWVTVETKLGSVGPGAQKQFDEQFEIYRFL